MKIDHHFFLSPESLIYDMKEFITYGHFIERSKFTNACHDRRLQFLNKPYGGLWCSPRDSKFGWYDWSMSEDFRRETLKRFSTFRLKNTARILRIDSRSDLCNIYQRYGIKESYERIFNWDKIIEDYDAVFLTEKGNRGCHYDSLNSWDCESMVILRWEIIDEKSIKWRGLGYT